MASKSKILGVVVVTFVALGALWLWSGSKMLQGTPAVAQQAATVAAGGGQMPTQSSDRPVLSVTRRNQPISNSPVSSLVALPPIGAKVSDVLLQLRDAADHGDARAACRVGLELARCLETAEHLQQRATSYETALRDSAPAAEIASKLARLDAARTESANAIVACEGVDPKDTHEAWSYLLQSANAGNAAAAAYFFRDPPVASVSDNSMVLDAWSDHLEAFRDLAIRSRDVYALNDSIAQLFAGVGMPGPSRPIPKDLYRSAVYTFAMAQLATSGYAAELRGSINDYEGVLSEDDIAKARVEGEQLHEMYFTNAPTITGPLQSSTFAVERCASP